MNMMSNFNNNFYRHQDDNRIMYAISSKMQTSPTLWDMAAAIHNHKTKKSLTVVDMNIFDLEENYFMNLTGTNYKAALCVVKGESAAELNGYWTVKDCLVRNNVFVDCRYGFVINYGGRDTQDSAPRNLTISGNKLISGKSYMIPVTVLDGTPADAVKWDGNIICGGSLKGVSLETVKTAPEYDDPSGAIKNIKENAGIQW
jgi:hypothetical protein